MTRPRKIPSQAGFEPGSSAPEVDALTTRPTRLSLKGENNMKQLLDFSQVLLSHQTVLSSCVYGVGVTVGEGIVGNGL